MKQVTEQTKRYLLSVGYPNKEEIFYLEVWLWLAHEKLAWIDATYLADGTWESEYSTPNGDVAVFNDFTNQEDAIAAAIEDLVKEEFV